MSIVSYWTGRTGGFLHIHNVLYGSHGLLADTSATDDPKNCSLGTRNFDEYLCVCLCAYIHM